MITKVWLDAGHGGSDSGAVNAKTQEKVINLIVAMEVKRLLELNGITVGMSRTTDKYLSLSERCDMANRWKAELLVSIHHNAGGGDGLEAIHSVHHNKSEELATLIAKTLSSNTGQNIRRVFSREGKGGDDYYGMIRMTNMPAVIVEYGFLDNLKDYAAFDESKELLIEAKYIAIAMLQFIGIKVPNLGSNPAPAPAIEAEMCDIYGDGKYIMTLEKYAAQKKAQERVANKLNKECEVRTKNGDVIWVSHESPNDKPPVVTPAIGVPIMGASMLTAQQMAEGLLRVNKNPKIPGTTPDTVVNFCAAYLVIGYDEGVRGDIAFAQALVETGYFNYGGSVKSDQCNFCGLSEKTGFATFANYKEGITAHIQHLKAYADKTELNLPQVDPKFNAVTRGISPYWETLSGKWALPGFNKTKYDSLDAAMKAEATYGHLILNTYKLLGGVVTPRPIPVPVDPRPIPFTPGVKSKYFNDIPANHWSIPMFDKAKELGIIAGDGKGNVGFSEGLARIITINIRSVEYVLKETKSLIESTNKQ